MTTKKFNNEKEFNNWERTHINGGIIFEFGEFDTPMMYPCIMVYEFIEQPYCNCDDDFEQYNKLKAEGYDSDEIEKLTYHYVYPTDFD